MPHPPDDHHPDAADVVPGDDAERDGAPADGPDDAAADAWGRTTEFAAPVVGCRRCGALVPLGSRYCPRCGTPLVRSGEQAARDLSRTRRPAPPAVRITVPLVVAAVVAAVALLTLRSGGDDGPARPEGLDGALAAVVRDDRLLAARLQRLRPGGDAAPALAAARAAAGTVAQALQVATADHDVAGRAARADRVAAALRANRRWLQTVRRLLADPRAPGLAGLEDRAQEASDALDAVDDVQDTDAAVAGVEELDAYLRAARRGAPPPGRTATTATTPTTPTPSADRPEARSPFVTAVDGVLRAGARARPDRQRATALLRAARDGLDGYAGAGATPASADAAVDEARELLGDVARARERSAARARAVTTRQDNQASIVEKLGRAYDAGAAAARDLADCLAASSAAPRGVAAQCLARAQGATATEARATDAFVRSYRPALRALGRSGPSRAL
ncbi:zinc ribbon domain-containing protein [Patulibacter sp. SYSU D01012]|uniref:zinc ribbon domain-containing protein n=1 Tax=Patulibacter sp. SYSU D01012 TaxID=2817381 RepID=UPI001B318717|nr:zinc ribbon domain-containing protein [Patulibacter sp. SYSU D01012]